MKPVRYMLMMHIRLDEVAGAANWSADDLRRMIAFQRAFDQRLVDSGEMVFNAGLAWPSEARVVRFADGESVVSDGPFAPGREFLIGFWIVECATPERAAEIAAEASSSPGPGGLPTGVPIEVRALAGAPDPDAVG